MSGSMGCGPFEELMEMISFRLPEDTTLTIVCGSNQKIYHTLLDKAAKNVRVLGQVSNISALMDCSEMIITKPGGLTVSEAAAKRLPLLLLDIVGGCETYNLNFFTQKGWAEHRPTLEQTAQLCCTLLDHPEVLAQKRKLLAQGFPNRPAEMLIDELCEAIKFKNSTVIQLSVDA